MPFILTLIFTLFGVPYSHLPLNPRIRRVLTVISSTFSSSILRYLPFLDIFHFVFYAFQRHFVAPQRVSGKGIDVEESCIKDDVENLTRKGSMTTSPKKQEQPSIEQKARAYLKDVRKRCTLMFDTRKEVGSHFALRTILADAVLVAKRLETKPAFASVFEKLASKHGIKKPRAGAARYLRLLRYLGVEGTPPTMYRYATAVEFCLEGSEIRQKNRLRRLRADGPSALLKF